MKLGSYHILTTSPQTKPSIKLRKFASLALHQRYLYGRPQRNNTGKELDTETGLYYYGARYLDPKISRWLSGDPAVGEYIPSAPVNEEARKRNGSLPGMGGVFNYANLHVYHYAGNNPVKYRDPDGMNIELQNDNLSSYEFEYSIKLRFNTVMNSDTDAGQKLREIYEDSNINLIIIFGRGKSEEGSYYERGGNLIYIEMSEIGNEIFDHPGVIKTFGTLIAHESGHAHAYLYGYEEIGENPYYTLVFRERIATAVENNYRVLNGLKQREVYHTLLPDNELVYFNVPMWNAITNSWMLMGREWKMPTR